MREDFDREGVYNVWYGRGDQYRRTYRVAPAGCRLVVAELSWRRASVPGLWRVCRRMAILGWWLHRLVTGGRRPPHRIYAIYRGTQLVHYAVVLPRNPRFPFMEADDVQIGPVWTAENARGLGLQSVAMDRYMSDFQKPGRGFWWICRRENTISNHIARQRGFRLAAVAARRRRFGLLASGYFELVGPPASQCAEDESPVAELQREA